MHRFKAVLFAITALAAAFVAPAQAQSFPTKAVRIVVPYPAGGSTDVLARALANELTQVWRQPVVVENIGGAGSIIGTERIATSAPDGHNLLFTIDPTVVGNRFLYKKLPYDPDKSLTPISMIARSGQFIIVHPSFPATTLREVVEAVRRSPGKIAYSSYGLGTHPHLVLEMIAKREGLQFLHVPYKGIAPSTAAVVAGEVQLSVGSPAATGAMVKAGRLRAITLTGPSRTGRFPDVQTSAEAGFPYVKAIIWFGLFAPGGADPKLVERIHADVTTIAKRPDFTEKHIDALSLDLVANTPAEFAAAIRADVENIGEMVKAAAVQPE
jgi:tripartite-type tricarboxylate transporter receptor subunit TctC